MRRSIDFEWYKVFYEVALRGSVSGAATDMSVSQPAVSQSIRNLEQAFGVRLFRRRSRGVELTETGRELYSYVRESYRLLKLGERAVYGLLEKSAGSLLVAAPEDLGSYYLTPLFRSFKERYPDFQLQCQTLHSGAVVDQVRSGSLEAGFVTLPVDTRDLELVPLMEIEDVFVTAPSSPLLKGNPPGPRELLGEPLAAPSAQSTAGQTLNQWLAPPADWSPVYISSNPEGIRRFVAAGLGVGFLPATVLETDESETVAVLAVNPAHKKPETRRGAFIYSRKPLLSEGVRSLRSLLAELYP